MSAILFTVGGSNRHEIISLPSSISLKTLNSAISSAVASSPNCAEFMSKYKKESEEPEQVSEMKIRWSPAGRDAKIWPQSTVVTDENVGAVMRLVDPGKDVLEVKIG